MQTFLQDSNDVTNQLIVEMNNNNTKKKENKKSSENIIGVVTLGQ